MCRNAKVLPVFVGLCVFTAAAVQAEGLDRRADRNRDNVIDKKESHMAREIQKTKVDTPWEKRADSDKDGVVERGEAVNAKKLADRNNDGIPDPVQKKNSWLNSRAKVNTPIEAKYDKNGDGWLEGAEAKDMLQDKHALVMTQGKAKVDTDIERSYDTNVDGMLDMDEARKMRQDIE